MNGHECIQFWVKGPPQKQIASRRPRMQGLASGRIRATCYCLHLFSHAVAPTLATNEEIVPQLYIGKYPPVRRLIFWNKII